MTHFGGRTPVLVTGGEYVGVLAALRALAAAGFAPWVAASHPRAHAALSRTAAGSVHVPDPREDPDGFVRATQEASERLRAIAVLPGTESALLAFASAQHRPSESRIAIGPPEALALATDKAALPALAAAAGLQTPPTVLVTGVQVGGPQLQTTYPAVVKPLRSELPDDDGRLRHFTPRRVDSDDELRAQLARLPGDHGLLQPFLRGRLLAFGGICWRGELVCGVWYAGLRIWPRHCGTICYAVTIPPDHDLERSIRSLLATIGWSGICQLQFIEQQDGERFLIDLNPRIFASLAIATAAGMNLPAIWMELLLGGAPRVGSYQVGICYRFLERDLHALLVHAVAGRPRSALGGLLPRRRTTHAVATLRDPAPALAVLAKVGSSFAARRRAEAGAIRRGVPELMGFRRS